MSSPFLIVAIDGGAAAGKSTTARALSARFNFLHIDTGSHYRAITAELTRAMSLIGVRVLDHFVVGAGCSVSLAERGML